MEVEETGVGGIYSSFCRPVSKTKQEEEKKDRRGWRCRRPGTGPLSIIRSR